MPIFQLFLRDNQLLSNTPSHSFNLSPQHPIHPFFPPPQFSTLLPLLPSSSPIATNKLPSSPSSRSSHHLHPTATAVLLSPQPPPISSRHTRSPSPFFSTFPQPPQSPSCIRVSSPTTTTPPPQQPFLPIFNPPHFLAPPNSAGRLQLLLTQPSPLHNFRRHTPPLSSLHLTHKYLSIFFYHQQPQQLLPRPPCFRPYPSPCRTLNLHPQPTPSSPLLHNSFILPPAALHPPPSTLHLSAGCI